MRIICKKNTELNYRELEVLYQMYKYNNEKIIYDKNNHKIKEINENSYKDYWINAVLENDSLLCFICLEEEYLIGFSFLILNEDENYINEFHIHQSKQHDGETFRYMVKNMFEKSQPNKDFTGRIWKENYNAQKIFKSMGALLIDKKYHLKYEKVKQWLDKK